MEAKGLMKPEASVKVTAQNLGNHEEGLKPRACAAEAGSDVVREGAVSIAAVCFLRMQTHQNDSADVGNIVRDRHGVEASQSR